MRVPELAAFGDFYRAMNRGRDPFPWQRRLAATVAAEGWPDEIGIPTGLGKTSCIDVAVWALASQATRQPFARTAPTRIWYVVNRRLLVDAAYEHGRRLARVLANPELLREEGATDSDVMAATSLAVALNLVGGNLGSGPLQVTRLRGGAELGSRPSHPAQPSVIFATVPMFASRWLFRGYGCSAGMRPVDAALAGTDSLVLLDEAHLAPALARLCGPLAECDVGEPTTLLNKERARPVLVSLTATGDAVSRFFLDSDDLAHPIVQRRLDARKPISLVASKEKALVNDLCAELGRNLTGRRPSAAVIFVNAPRTARAVFDLLREKGRKLLGEGADLELLTGRIRDREGDSIRSRLLDPNTGAPAGRDRAGLSRHLVVVATQTLEVGADLDFDILVTEACGARSLVQRLGRLNRLGDVDDAAGSVVFAADAKTFGVYGEQPKEVWNRLTSAVTEGVVDMGPRTITGIVGPPNDDPPLSGELLHAHLWEWAKTSRPPVGEAPPELFFDGLEPRSASLSVFWRVVDPEPGHRLVPPLTANEAVELPIWEVRSFAQDRELSLCRLSPDRAMIEAVQASELRPGDQVVLPSSVGGYDRFGWAPSAQSEVLDLSLLRPPGIPLVPAAFRMLLKEGDELDAALEIISSILAHPDPEEPIDRAILQRDLLSRMHGAGPNPQLSDEEWQSLRSRILVSILYPPEGQPRLGVRAVRSERHDPVLRAEVFDELSFTASSPAVADHNGSVAELAAKVAERIGIPENLRAIVALAGRFHDIGKCDLRFQQWLDPEGRSAEPIAKSSRPWQRWQADWIQSGWPKGGRHEELSRRIIEAWAANGSAPEFDLDLLLHLVATHHGQGRPLVLPVRDPFATQVNVTVESVPIAVSADLSQVDWQQPARFRRCCDVYGYWGLALLEAVLRQADHAVSGVVVA